MYRTLLFSLCLLVVSAVIVAAEEAGVAGAPAAAPAGAPAPAEPDAKMVRGMSVLGNNEAPMSLFIVPWKSSELGVETSLSRTLNERDVPVDREVFMRELDFYRVSVAGKK